MRSSSIGVYFGFTKDIPFTHGFRVKAVFESANSIRPDSPVRIAGVNVGKVKKVERRRAPTRAVVTMEIKDAGLPIHEDATAKIRPRIFLEGNFFVDLKPGTPAAPTLDDGDTIPVTQTATPVQLDEVLTALQTDTREDLQDVLDGLGGGAERQADRRRRPRRRPLGARARPPPSRSTTPTTTSPPRRARDRAGQPGAARHRARAATSRGCSSGLARTTAGLDRNEEQLKDLITNFNTHDGARSPPSRATCSASIRAARRRRSRPPTRAFDALNAAFPPTRAFAREILPGVRETPATIDAAFPWIDADARGCCRQRELRGLAQDLSPGDARPRAARPTRRSTLLPQIDLHVAVRAATSSCRPATS